MDSSHRSTFILNKAYKEFFHCDDFHWAYRPVQNLLPMFMLALEIKFERVPYLHDEGYKTSDDYDLCQPLNKSTHIYAVPSVAAASFNPTDYQTPMIPTPMSTPNEDQ